MNRCQSLPVLVWLLVVISTSVMAVGIDVLDRANELSNSSAPTLLSLMVLIEGFALSMLWRALRQAEAKNAERMERYNETLEKVLTENNKAISDLRLTIAETKK